MNARVLNILCLMLLISFAVWSILLWRDGRHELAQYVLVWALVLPAIVRGLVI